MKRLLPAVLVLLLAPTAAAIDLTVRLQNGTDKTKGVVGAEIGLLLPVANPAPGEPARKRVLEKIESGDSVVFHLDDALAGSKINVFAYYQGGEYFYTNAAEIGKPEAGPFTVYEATDDRGVVEHSQHWVQLVPHEGVVQVSERVTVRNGSDRAFIGTKIGEMKTAVTLLMHVPAEAANFEVSGSSGYFLSDRVKRDGDVWITDATILPGDQVFDYAYDLPAGKGTLEFQKFFSAPTSHLVVFAPDDPAFHVHVEGLEGQREKDPHTGRTLVVFHASDVEPSRKLAFRIHFGEHEEGAGGKKKEEPRKFEGPLLPLALVALTAGALLSVAASLRPNPTGGVQVEKMRELLVEEIARLDLSREKGEIGEEYHRKQRESLKKRLLELG